MKIDVPYNYINLLAFLNAMKYENIRCLKIKDLNSYRVKLLERVLEEYIDPNISFYAEEDQWEGAVTFSVFDEKKAMREFIKDYSHILYLDGDTIYLNDDVDYKMLNHEVVLLRKEEVIGNRFTSVSHHKDLLSILGISKIEKLLMSFLKIEEEIEKGYMSLGSSDEINLRNLKKNLLMRVVLLQNLKNSEDYFVDAFRLVASELYYDDCYEYDVYPLSMDLWENSEYYSSDKDDIFNDIDDRLYEIYQYAIFGEESLSIQKLWGIIDDLYFFELPAKINELMDSDDELDDCCDDVECEDEDFDLEDEYDDEMDFDETDEFAISDSAVEDYAFYMSYIDKLNKYINIYGEDLELERVKKRLLYALDKPDLALYREDNFKNELISLMERGNEKSSFKFVEDEARFMASEVFLVPEDKNTIKKLLFVSTYYDLTDDDAIKDIVGRYLQHEKFRFYSEVMFGRQKNKAKIKNKDNN